MNYHDLQKEKELLGMILKRPKLLQASNVAISEDLFFSEINQNIFKKINSFITVKELNHNLSKEEWYKKAGGHTYLMECINLAEVEGISEYVLLVRELQDLKTIRDILNAIEKAKNEVGKEENDTIISGLLKQVRLMQRKSPLGDLDDLKNFDDIYGEDYGISTGLHDLDRLIGGLRKSNLIILGARPGAGKSSCAATIAMNTSKEYNTLFFNLEMSSKEMKRKFIAIKSGVPYKKITENTCDNTERGFISQAIKAISESKIVLSSPEKKPNIAQIEKVATKIKDKQGLDLIIIDYLNYIKADDKRLQMTYQVEQKVQDLKMLAKQLDVPIILLVQLSREFDKRNANTSSAPFLSDIKDSGSIEQEADSVVLLHRESMYNNQNKGLAQFHVRKNRHGATGMRSLAFDEETGKFSNLIEEN